MQVREFMLSKVLQLKRPKTNIQIIQSSVLLKHTQFMRFLRLHGQDVYTEVRRGMLQPRLGSALHAPGDD